MSVVSDNHGTPSLIGGDECSLVSRNWCRLSLSRYVRLEGKVDEEERSLSRSLAARGNAAPVQLYELLGNGKAQTQSAMLARRPGIIRPLGAG